MYGGRIMESAGVEALFADPRHPYTVGLLHSLPDFHESDDVLYSIPGLPPAVHARPTGCVFHPRCGLGRDRAICREAAPPLAPVGSPAHRAACHFADETPAWAARTIARAQMQHVEQGA
jgi:oligopeptide/dipeptide ABC transporter ATP-binding protein